MKKFLVGLGVFVVILLMAVAGAWQANVDVDEVAGEQLSNIQVDQARRFELIPNLVAAVKGSMAHEEEVLTAVTEARAKVSQMNVDLSSANADDFQAISLAQAQLGSSLSRLIATVESYPDLKANAQIADLMVQLEGTENRIAVSRKRYNEAARNLNRRVRGLWSGLVAKIQGIEKRSMFEASVEEQQPIRVDLSR